MGYRLARFAVRLVFRLLAWILGGFSVSGEERVPARGGVIIAPNHLSHLDPPAVGTAMRRPAWFMATDELFGNRLAALLARLLHAFPIRQDSPDLGALRKAEDVLEAGEALVIFPEGHESRTGELQPLQPGVLLLAKRARVPIVPVGVAGSDAMLPAATWRLRRSGRPLRVRFGHPVTVEELTGGVKGRAGLDAGAERLREHIAQVLREMGEEPRLGAAREAPASRAGTAQGAGEV